MTNPPGTWHFSSLNDMADVLDAGADDAAFLDETESWKESALEAEVAFWDHLAESSDDEDPRS